MTSPARVDQEIWRGDNYPPLSWGFGPATAPEIPNGAAFELDVTWNLTALTFALPEPLTGTITALSPSDLTVDYTTGTVTWPYTEAQSASIPRGAHAEYVLRCIQGGATQTWAYGRLFLKDGSAV